MISQDQYENYLHSQLAERASEHARMQAVIDRLRSSDQTVRLALGEMTKQEMRTVRAAFRWALAAGSKPVA